MIPDLIRKDGQSLQKFFEDNETLSMLEEVRKWLTNSEVFKKFLSSDVVSTKSLAGLIIQMLNCYETSFGRNVSKPVMTRLPVKFFLDFKAGGALCLILGTMFRIKSERNWRRFDFTSSNRLDSVAEAFMAIEECLVQAKLFTVPNVFIRPDVDSKLTVKLVEILKRHKGNVTSSFEGATHVIYPPGPPPPTDEDFVRPLYNNGSNCLVHLWFYPDSCNCFLPSNYVPTIEPRIDLEEHIGSAEKYEVNARWVLDLDDFNEWMCEDDYALDTKDGQKFMTAPVYRNTITRCIPVSSINDRISGKRKKSPSPVSNSDRKKRKTAPKKRRADEDESSNDMNFDQTSQNLPSPTKPSGSDSTSNDIPSFADNAKQGTQYLTAESDVNSSSATASTKEPLVAKEIKEAVPPISGPIEKPNQNNDFTKNQVTVLETSAAAVKDSTSRHETATEQTHHIIIPSYAAWFDYNAIHAIEKRALPEFFNEKNKSKTPEIYLSYRNFMVDSYRINPQEYLFSTALRRNLTGDVCALMRIHAFLEQWGLINFQIDLVDRPKPMGPPSTSHFHILGDTPSGLKPIQPVRPSLFMEPKKEPAGESREAKTSTEASSSIGGHDGNTQSSSTAPSTSAVALAQNLGLRTDKYSKPKDKAWSDKEMLMLLEAVDLYKDDWNRVAEHVGTRNQHQCIMQFLQLPIEDPYVDPSNLNGLEDLVPVPYSQQGNPLMTTVAFLSSVVDPRVAKQAAESALEKFEQIKDELPKAFVEEKIENAEKLGVTDVKGIVKLSDIAGCDEEEEEEEEEEDNDDAMTEKADETPDEKSSEEIKKPESESVEPESESKKPPTGAPDETEESKSDEPMETDVGNTTASETSADSDATIEATGSGAGNNTEESTESSKSESKPEQAVASVEDETGDTEEKMDDENTAVEVKKEFDPEEARKSLTTAASTALAASAVKARHLQSLEERRIKSLVAIVIETQMKKLDMKMKYFEELETIMERERETLECQKAELVKERQQFYMEQIKSTEDKLKGIGMADMALETLSAKQNSSPAVAEPCSSSTVVNEKVPSQASVPDYRSGPGPASHAPVQHYPGQSQPSGSFAPPSQPTARPHASMRSSPGPASHPSFAGPGTAAHLPPHPMSRPMPSAPGPASASLHAGSGFHPGTSHGQMPPRAPMGQPMGYGYPTGPGSPASNPSPSTGNMQAGRPVSEHQHQATVQPRPNSRNHQAPNMAVSSQDAVSAGASASMTGGTQAQPSFTTSSPSSSVSSVSGSSVTSSSVPPQTPVSVPEPVKSGVFPIKQVANPSAVASAYQQTPSASQQQVSNPYQQPQQKYPPGQSVAAPVAVSTGMPRPAGVQSSAVPASAAPSSSAHAGSNSSQQPHAPTYAGTVPTPQPAAQAATSATPAQPSSGQPPVHYGSERPGYTGPAHHPGMMHPASGPYPGAQQPHGYPASAPPPSAHPMSMFPPHSNAQMPAPQHRGYPGSAENPNYPHQVLRFNCNTNI